MRTATAVATPALSPVRELSPSLSRISAKGKFLWAGGEKFYIRGTTYGPFHPDADGTFYPAAQIAERDFAHIAASGMNAIRTYDVPPGWLLDIAWNHNLRVLVGLQVEQLASFLNDSKVAHEIEKQVRSKIGARAGHPAILAYVIANEIPASIVRWHGARRIERFLEDLHSIAKFEDPEGLFCYANYPTTEYLDLAFLDLVCFNVYLESQSSFESYVARLQALVGNRPLVMTEVGLDSRGHGLVRQAQTLEWQIRSTFAAGCAGAFVFAWTDDWYSRGKDVEEWDFGLTDRARRPKPALTAVRSAFAGAPFPTGLPWPRISVVVCTFNGQRTIRDCLDGLGRLRYPGYEVIVVDDGSTDNTASIVREYGFRIISTANQGLSAARNTGWEAATGEIVAYIDDDASPDPDWLTYLASTFLTADCAGVGGPNLPFPGDGPIANCVANSPGGPTCVLLSDTEAEHVPGCNMAFRKPWLQAVGGFDPQFRVAGDDVDICWRVRERGGTLCFSPAAVVWHHYRNSIRAYWKQQTGYGKAEALLERKYPEKFNCAGHMTWSGRIYGNGLVRGLGWGRGRIYQGTWGSAAYARVYYSSSTPFKSLPFMPESYLISGSLAALGAIGCFWKPLLIALPVSLLAVGWSLVDVLRCVRVARLPSDLQTRFTRWRLQGLTVLLHPLQNLARLRGRLRFGLTPWRRRRVTLSSPSRRTFWLASPEWQDSIERLQRLESALRASGAIVRRGGCFDNWDLEARNGMLASVRILMAEEYSAGQQVVRVRSWPRLSGPWLALALFFGVLSIAALCDHAGAAATILGSVAAVIGAFSFQDCAGAAGIVQRSLIQQGFSKGRRR
jgi:GT2 family glycosyltransferase